MNVRLKKIGVLIMIFFLLISTGGLAITRHYCGHSFISYSFLTNPKPCCGSDCGKCHNEICFNKVTDEFTSSSHQFIKADIPLISLQAIHLEIKVPLPESSSLKPLTTRKFLFQDPGDLLLTYGNFRC